jgi:hypothetical protein
MSELEENFGSPDQTGNGPEGLLFTGDAVRELSPDQLRAIGDFAHRMYGVEMRTVHSVEQELGDMALTVTQEEEPEPVPMTRGELIEFALTNGYTKNFANNVWRSLTSEDYRKYIQPYISDLPGVSFRPRPGGRSGQQEFDLRSVYARLRSDIRPSSRRRLGTPSDRAFLAFLVNEKLQPDEPLEPETW